MTGTIAGKTLVVGAGSGLGKYLTSSYSAVPFLRGDALEKLPKIDTIIYCAADARFSTPFNAMFSALESNILLLNDALKLSHSRFIYLSSADVYPADGRLHTEDEKLTLEAIKGGYPSFKLAGEALVSELASNPLILRPTSLFGQGMRPNNIIRLLNNTHGKITLTETSNFNCISYSMIAQFIQFSIEHCTTGTFNCAATNTVSLKEVADHVGYGGPFGEIEYQAPKVNTSKICSIMPSFKATSAETLYAFLENYTV